MEARIHNAGGGEMQLREGRNGGRTLHTVTYDRHAKGNNRDQQIDEAVRLIAEYAKIHGITIVGDDDFDYPDESVEGNRMTYDEYLKLANEVEIALGHPMTRNRHQQVLARDFRQAAEGCLPEGWMRETDPADDIDTRFQNAVKAHIAAASANEVAELKRVGDLIKKEA